MFDVNSRVQFVIEERLLLGTVTAIQTNPVTGLTHYIVDRKNGDSYALLWTDLTPYEHAHLPKGFCK